MTPPVYKTCDLCRKRKTRCVPSSEDRELRKTIGSVEISQRCRTCSRAGTTCTFLKGYQKPGRPRASTAKSMSPIRDGPSLELGFGNGGQPGPSTSAARQQRQTDVTARLGLDSHSDQRANGWTGHFTTSDTADLPDTTYDIFDAFVQPSPSDPFNPPIISPFNTSNSNPSPHDFTPAAAPPATTTTASSQPISNPSSSSTARPLADHRLAELARLNNIPISPQMPLEDVGPWSAMSEILSVYLRYLHSLFPLVHKPSFSQKLAMRADQTDRGFAALLLGIVAYTIGQSPLGRLGSYSRQELHWLQRRCHSASICMLDRRYRRVTVNQICTLMAGYFYCQSTGETNRAIALLAEACQLTHVLCLRGTDEPDFIEQQLRRRVFWHVYAVDSTEASAGHPIHLNAFEGLPPLPLDVDDEFLTPLGSFQPSTDDSIRRPSTELVPPANSSLSGFNGCVALFPILGQTIARHRSLRHRLSQGDIPTPAEVDVDRAWVGRMRAELQTRMENTPKYLKDPEWVGGSDEGSAVRGMQRANVLVTEASIEFALLAFAEDLETNAAVAAEERARIGRNTFEVLSSLPLDDLAANGESMRGKIFRIMLEMLRGDNPEEWVNQLHDWCNLVSPLDSALEQPAAHDQYSRVQYVQLAVNDLESLFPSRQQSPEI